jgi:Na+/melibiose symporter-like transporter
MAGAYVGCWNLATKATLAIAAGIALPLLDWYGYQPGIPGAALGLALTYAALPCALKLFAAILLVFAPPESVTAAPPC